VTQIGRRPQFATREWPPHKRQSYAYMKKDEPHHRRE